jgi:hypothetical protein
MGDPVPRRPQGKIVRDIESIVRTRENAPGQGHLQKELPALGDLVRSPHTSCNQIFFES